MAKRGSNIYKRKDGRFEGRVHVGYRENNANNLRKSNRIFRRSNFPLMRTKRTLKRTIRFDRNGLTHTK